MEFQLLTGVAAQTPINVMLERETAILTHIVLEVSFVEIITVGQLVFQEVIGMFLQIAV